MLVHIRIEEAKENIVNAILYFREIRNIRYKHDHE